MQVVVEVEFIILDQQLQVEQEELEEVEQVQVVHLQ